MKICNLAIKRNVCSRKVCIRRVSTVLFMAPDWTVEGYTLGLGLVLELG